MWWYMYVRDLGLLIGINNSIKVQYYDDSTLEL